MSRPEPRRILKVCQECGRVLASDFPGDLPEWTLYDPVVEQAQLELRSGNSRIERVNLCEVCRGEYYISALVSAG